MGTLKFDQLLNVIGTLSKGKLYECVIVKILRNRLIIFEIVKNNIMFMFIIYYGILGRDM